MKLTTKGRFAVTAMVDLALHLSEAPVRIALIAERQNLSVAYLEQIFCKLRRAGLVTSARGPGGGYRLGDLPENISVGQIIEAVDEDIDATQCHGGDTCKGGAACLTHHLWEDLNRVTLDFLSRVTLADMVRRNEERAARKEAHVSADIPVRRRN